MLDMTRPSSVNPGRTYKWYENTPVYEFGYGLHFTTFDVQWQRSPPVAYNITTLIAPGASQGRPLDLAALDTITISVKNTGTVASDYVVLLFLNSTAGPAPFPNKQLVSYTRLHQIQPGATALASLDVTLGSVARADTNGNMWLFSGEYQWNIDTGPVRLTAQFALEGNPFQITEWPQEPSA